MSVQKKIPVTDCCALPKGASPWTLFAAVAFALCTGFLQIPLVFTLSESIAKVFVNFLKLLSLPIIFLSIVSTASGMSSLDEMRSIGKRILTYTLLTTLFAATLAFVLFNLIAPISPIQATDTLVSFEGMNYLDYFIGMVPSNIIEPFATNHVMGVLFLAIVFSISLLSLKQDTKEPLHQIFSGLFQAVMGLCQGLLRFMPIAIFAFVNLFMKDLQEGLDLETLGWYLLCVMAANFIQAGVILPLFALSRGIAPLRLARQMWPALSVAFFTKSSSAALPVAMDSATRHANIDPKIAQFSLPLCTTINMNACAAFIFITVLFVSMSHGATYSMAEQVGWIFIATLAAVGNAGVPMGCYFLSGALLATMNVPLHILGVILPFYSLIDMFESAINVWSDAVVTAAVDRDMKREQTATLDLPNPA